MFGIRLLCRSLFAATARGNRSRQSVAVATAHGCKQFQPAGVTAENGASQDEDTLPLICYWSIHAPAGGPCRSNQGSRTKVQQKGDQTGEWTQQYLGIPTGLSGVFSGSNGRSRPASSCQNHSFQRHLRPERNPACDHMASIVEAMLILDSCLSAY